MNAYPLFYLGVVAFGWSMAIFRGPLWGLITYVFIYFNIPSQQWWGGQVPALRWSYLSAGILLASCFLHKRQLAPASVSKNTLASLLLLLLLWMMLISPFTPDPEMSWTKVYDFFRYVLILFIINKVLADFTAYKKFVGVLLYCTFYLAVLANHYFHGSRLDGVGLPDGSDANMLAALVILVLPLYVVFFFTEKGWIRFLPLGAMVSVINMFAMCGSRGAFVGFSLQMVIALVLLRKQIGLIKAIACCLVVAVCLFSLMSPEYRNRLLALKSDLQGEDTELQNTSAGRTEIWKYGLLMAKDYPMGAGGGAFEAMSPQYIPASLIQGSVGHRASHNTYLLIFVEQGWIGLGIFLLFLLTQFRLLYKTLRSVQLEILTEEKKKVVYHTYAVTIGLTGFWVASFFIDRLYFEAIYLVVALIPVLIRLVGEQYSEDTKTLQ